MNKRKVPKIRFKGFHDDWEQRKFGEVFIPLQNNTLSRAELNDEFGTAQNIHYGDVLIKYDEVLDVSKESLSYIEKQSIADKFKTSYLQNGDVIIADTAEDETVGKCTEIEGLTDQKVISGLHTMPVRPNRKFAAGFLGFYLNSAAYHDQLKPLMQGIKVTSISKGVMQDTVVKFPLDLKEQEQIGMYFSGLDHLITLHQRKLEKMKIIKKSMLENCFPKNGEKVPKNRFSGFSDDWEQRKLDEILIQRVEHQTISADAPLLAFSYADGVIDPEDKKSNKRDFIMADKYSKIFSRTELNDIIYNPANVIHGAIHRNKLGTGVVSPIYKIFVCNNVSPKYMGERLHTDIFIQEITKYIEGTVIKLRTLSPEMFLEMMVEIPSSYEEQEKIGKLFEYLDSLITLHQSKLEKLKMIKKSMLETMFV